MANCYRLLGAALLLVTLVVNLPSQETKRRPSDTIRKPTMADTIRANVYADKSFQLYINGELVAVDSIIFIPHNVISVDLLPAYPMTIAVMAIDNADPKTGLEYANTNIGDGGFILKLGDGTVTNATWKAQRIAWGPVDGDLKNPKVERVTLPTDWFAVGFDDRNWSAAREYTPEEIGPKEPFFAHDFEGAKFIWSDNIQLDNIVLFRTVIPAPPDGKSRVDFRGLTDRVPATPRRDVRNPGPARPNGRRLPQSQAPQ